MENILTFFQEHSIIKIIVIAFGTLFIIIPINYLVFKIIKKAWKIKEIDIKETYKKLRSPLIWLLWAVILLVGFTFIELPEELKDKLVKILSLLLIVTITWLSIRLVNILKNFFLISYDITKKDNLRERRIATQFKIFERFIIVTILLIAISSGLMLFEKIRQLGVNILASAGIAGIIIGFAAQKSIANILAGIQIAITQPIRLDDVVIVEKEWGWIEEITLTYVVVRIWDKRRLILPINYFIEKPFENWTRKSSDILGTVFIYTDYKMSVNAIREELTRLLEETDLWDQKVNVLQVTNSTEKSMELRVLVSAKDSPTAWDLRVYIREKLIEYMQKNYPGHLPKTRIEINQQKNKEDNPYKFV